MARAVTVAFEKIVQAEGGYVNDPNDPGGPTNWGVSWRAVHLRDVDRDGNLDFDLDGDGDVDEHDIQLVTKAHAEQLFIEDYWSLARCDRLPARLAVTVADSAYLQGPRTAAALVQRALRVKSDGIIGPKTARAARAATATKHAEDQVLARFAVQRLDRYRRAPSVEHHFRGWARRTLDLDRDLLAMPHSRGEWWLEA